MIRPPGWGLALAWVCLAGAAPLRAQEPQLTDGEIRALKVLDDGSTANPSPHLHMIGEQETKDWRVGVKVLGASPSQDFKDLDNRAGFGGALFVENDIKDGWQVQSYVSFIRFPKVTNTTFRGASVLTLSADSAALGVDLHYHLPFRGLEKLYVLAGLMGTSYEFVTTSASSQLDANLQPVGGTATSRYRTAFQLGTAVGLGLDLSRTFSFGVRYTYINIDGTAYATLETGLALRF